MSSSAEPLCFGYFDRGAEVEQTERYLPHWFQPGVATFITIRTADSLPRPVVAAWRDEQREWLRRQGMRLAAGGSLPDVDSLPPAVRDVFRQPVTCRKQCESWLRYSARRINQHSGGRGAFWQSEPFDHLVRSPEQFEYLQRYIADNPLKANLPEGESLFWSREGEEQGSATCDSER